MSKTTFKYPSLLSFRASIVPSIFAFYSFKESTKESESEFKFGDNQINNYLTPINVEKSILRTTIANFGDATKINESLQKGGQNIQTIEKATLPPDSDTLVIKGSVRFFNNSLTPEATNEITFKNVFNEYINLFKEKIGYSKLAELYFMNLINGQILWRNKYGNIETHIANEAGISTVFKVDDIIGENNLSVDSISDVDKKNKALEIIEKIEKAFTSAEYLTLNIVSKVQLGFGQAVYPSQEFDEEKKISRVLAKSKYNYKGNSIAQAVFHEQKIGNAIRTIDTWYNDKSEFPLAVEPYGIYQKEVKAYRASGNDFYTYFMKIDKLIEELQSDKFNADDNKLLNKHLFVIACLIRGGVYSGPSDKKKGKENAENTESTGE